MPANYTVVAAEKISDKPDRGYGPMQTIRLTLKNERGDERPAIEWYAKATTAVPTPGQQLFGDVTQSDYGWQFKKARTGPPGGSSGGGKDFKADPVKQAAIAAESAQKTAVEILKLAYTTDRPAEELAAEAREVAQGLYEQIQDAMKAAQ